MKIAIIGTETERVQGLVKEVMKAWDGAFGTPAATIYDETVEWSKGNPATREEREKAMGEYGAELLNRMALLADQYESYKEEKNLLYAGCPLDVLANGLFLYEKDPEGITQEAVEKLVYWNKRLIRNLDLIYILPPKKKEAENTGENAEKPAGEGEKTEETVEKTEEELDAERLEQIYFSLWLQYTDHFEESDIYPHRDCPGIALLETEDPISEMRMVVDKNGNLAGEESPEDIQKLYNSIRDPKILAEAKKILEKRTIPLVGVPQTSTIILD